MIFEINRIIARTMPFNWEGQMGSKASVEKVVLSRRKSGSFVVTKMKVGVVYDKDAGGWKDKFMVGADLSKFMPLSASVTPTYKVQDETKLFFFSIYHCIL